MLRTMRRHARAWFMQVLLFIIIVVFVFYFGSMRGRRQAESIAIVNDRPIGYVEFKNEYDKLLEYYRERFKGMLTDEVLKNLNLKQRAFDNVINEAVILAKADEYKLGASSEDIRAAITAYPAFQRDGVFDADRYYQMLRYSKLTPEEFESIQEKIIKIGKLERLIKEAIKVSDQEVYDLYRIQNEKINIDFVKLTTKNFEAAVTPSDEDLRNYLKKNEESFRVPRMIQLKYMAFLGKDYAGLEAVSDGDIADYYEHHKNEFLKSESDFYTLEEVKGDILEKLRFSQGMDAAAQEAEKANDVIYQEENFEEYAKENELTIMTTEFFPRDELPENLSNLKDLANHILEINEGETAPLLSSEEGFYIIKANAVKPSYIPTLDEARKEITASYIREESIRLCKQKAEEILDRLKKGESFKKIAGKEQLKIEETGLFLPTANVPVIGYSSELGQALFTLSEHAPYTEGPLYINDSYIIVKFKERGKLDLKDLGAEKDELKNILLKFKGEEQFRMWLESTKVDMMKNGSLKITADINAM